MRVGLQIIRVGRIDARPASSAWRAARADRRWLLADERGSIIAVSNESGTVTNINSYDEYGQPASGNIGRFGYTGQMWIAEAGLYHYKARAYQPGLGRFMQTDPIGVAGGMNLYGYVGNDPVNFSDPSGLQGYNGLCGNDPQCEAAAGSDTVVVTGSVIGGSRVGGQGSSTLSGFGALGVVSSPSGMASTSNTGSVGVGATGFTPASRCEDAEVECIVVQARREARNWHARMGGSGFGPIDGLWFCGGYIDLSYCGGRTYADPLGPENFIGEGVVLLRLGYGAARAGLGAVIKCGCFEAGAMVATPGGPRPIEEIVVGDLVLAWNEETGEVAPKAVTALIRPEPRELYDLALADASGTEETFSVTDDHPWMVEGKGWVETVALQPGDRIETATEQKLTVASLAFTGEVAQTYNLEVRDWHTFLVGDDQAVVHNCPFSEAKRILVRMFRDDLRRNGGRMGRQDFEAYRELNRTLRDPFPEEMVRIDTTGRSPRVPYPHGRFGPYNHFGIIDP